MLPHLGRTQLGAIHIIDDEFSMAPRRASEIAREMRRRALSPRLIYDSRAIDFLKGDFLEEIAEFTYLFLIGAECGYPEGLERVGKGITVETLEEAARRLAEAGLAEKAEYSFIVGLPWETIVEVRRTLGFAAHLYGSYGVKIRINWYTQMPGSRLWEEARTEQIVSEAMYDDYGFYRNLYLFRTGVRLTPRDIWEVRDIVEKLQMLGGALRPTSPPIDFFFPQAIAFYFPRAVATRAPEGGLVNLRKIARPDAAK
jgi:radical SAM superfamily enzyme YgiQ (UPF0313 family)